MIHSFSELFVSVLFVLGFLFGIRLMNRPQTALKGNLLVAFSMLGVMCLTLISNSILNNKVVWISIVIGGLIGYFLAVKVSMMQMPQLVAFLNGSGGGASALTALIVLYRAETLSWGTLSTGYLALAIGGVTLSGSLIAAGKLHRLLKQKPVILWNHSLLSLASLILFAVLVMISAISHNYLTISFLLILNALIFGILLTIRIGGADMPITISLLNSLSGLAASVTGFVIGNALLIAGGAVVGSAGLILTRVMCNAMNRSLSDIILGTTTTRDKKETTQENSENAEIATQTSQKKENMDVQQKSSPALLLQKANSVVIVPGYGMGVSQAQHQVKQLYKTLLEHDKEVLFGIHPVAGRMPGHMYVLLTEVDIPYEKLLDIETINPKFKDTDVVIVIGANDVINPSARTAEGTPIYGMPILNVSDAKHIIICNLDTKPGYAGVDNPLYTQDNVVLLLGDAAETVEQLTKLLKEA